MELTYTPVDFTKYSVMLDEANRHLVEKMSLRLSLKDVEQRCEIYKQRYLDAISLPDHPACANVDDPQPTWTVSDDGKFLTNPRAHAIV